MEKISQNTSLPIYHLIAILDDTKMLYLKASERIKDEVMSVLLERFGYQQGRYSKELQLLLRRAGASCPIDEFTLSLLHRTWMHVKTAFKFGQKEAVIGACIKGEETVLENYTIALEQLQDDDDVKIILQQQVNGIKTVLTTVKEYIAKSYS